MGLSDRQIARYVARWFARNGRDLPWRRRRTGYTGLVSEAMLQQTQVSRVIDRYRAFMKRFPSIRALAAADEQEVLALWQGLGYYRRARSLHAAARAIVSDHGGRVPRTAEALQTLPGVGRYSAGSIASIVFGRPAPLVDGNVRRVLSRFHDGPQPAAGESDDAWCWRRAREQVEATDDPAAFNEGLMELGATICMPRNPVCSRCPIERDCGARAAGTQHQWPVPITTRGRRRVHHHAIVVRRGGKLLIEQRPERGMWAGLWQVPTIEADHELAPADVRERLGVALQSLDRIGVIRHGTTHRDVTIHVFAGHSRARRGKWLAPGDLVDVPLSNAQHKVLALAGVVDLKSRGR